MQKKILFLIPSLEIGGGAEKIAALLTTRLSEKYKISIVTFYDCRNLYPYKGKYFSLNLKVKTWKKLFLPIKIYKIIKLISPNMIISFMDHTNGLAIIEKLIFRIKTPLIICVHTNPKIAYEKKDRYLNILIRLLYPLKLINKIITISKAVENILRNDYQIEKNKLQTIYNGIDLERVNELKEENISKHKNLFYDDSIIKFITIGRLHEVKGHKYLIDAFFEVKKQVPNSKLIIIGEGPLRPILEKKIKEKNLNNDVFLLGLKRNPYKYLAKSDIFVLSSLREGFPNVLLEALACGLPVISTDCETGPREILKNGKYGFLAKVKDKTDLADKMILIAMNNNYKQRFSKLSLERANNYDIIKITKIWLNTIEKEIYNNK